MRFALNSTDAMTVWEKKYSGNNGNDMLPCSPLSTPLSIALLGLIQQIPRPYGILTSCLSNVPVPMRSLSENGVRQSKYGQWRMISRGALVPVSRS